MTLLELLVVLLLLGLAAALVAPVLRLPAGRPQGDATADADAALARAADAARALALGRGESLVLAVAPDGRWTVRPAVATAGADTAPLLAGRAAPGAPRRVVVSPVGVCVPDATGATGAADAAGLWDAARCRPAPAAPAAAR